MATKVVFVSFIGGAQGEWRVDNCDAIRGPGLPAVDRITIVETDVPFQPQSDDWVLRGTTSYERYVSRVERTKLVNVQPSLGRPEAKLAALIPITKSQAWWDLTADERRDIIEERSHHIAIGLDYLPQVARRLHHCRDLGEPFDFLTWFEYAPGDGEAFNELVAKLRASEEWRFVEREIDIRLSRL